MSDLLCLPTDEILQLSHSSPTSETLMPNLKAVAEDVGVDPDELELAYRQVFTNSKVVLHLKDTFHT